MNFTLLTEPEEGIVHALRDRNPKWLILWKIYVKHFQQDCSARQMSDYLVARGHGWGMVHRNTMNGWFKEIEGFLKHKFGQVTPDE